MEGKIALHICCEKNNRIVQKRSIPQLIHYSGYISVPPLVYCIQFDLICCRPMFSIIVCFCFIFCHYLNKLLHSVCIVFFQEEVTHKHKQTHIDVLLAPVLLSVHNVICWCEFSFRSPSDGQMQSARGVSGWLVFLFILRWGKMAMALSVFVTLCDCFVVNYRVSVNAEGTWGYHHIGIYNI